MSRYELAAQVEGIIKDFVHRHPDNSLKDPSNERAWDEPIVGFSSGADELYEFYKDHIGPFHWTPHEIFSLTFPDVSGVSPKDLTVICWILPQTEATKADNRKESVYPSERWVRARVFGEEANESLRRHVVSALEAKGYKAVAPILSPLWSRETSPRFGRASRWSERHAAYVSGLGTFGLCDGLITPLGKAMRVGSVVALMDLPPTPRPYSDHRQYCLFFSDGTCGKCIGRCPVGAITKEGHDKEKCYQHVHVAAAAYAKAKFGIDGLGCGLCQTGVPCESRIPTAEDV